VDKEKERRSRDLSRIGGYDHFTAIQEKKGGRLRRALGRVTAE